MRDLRHSLRLIRRHPGHALAVILTLALAIGVGTVVIALVDRIVLRPLPFRDSERVMLLSEINERSSKHTGVSYPNLRDWAASSKSFEAMALARSWMFTLNAPAGDVSLNAGIATPQWLAIHSLQPKLGRFFRDGDMREGNNRVVILSDDIWRTRFGADRGIVGRQVRLDGKTYEIIGVLPEHAWIYDLDYADIWLPLTAINESVEKRGWRGFEALGRLAPGATQQSAKSELDTIRERLAKTYPESNAGWSVAVEPLRDVVAGPARKLLFIFLAAITVILLIACANIANLALSFNSWRSREFALRYAVGAGTRRIALQIVVESLVLALLGGAAGLAVAHAGLTLFRAVAPADIPRLDEVTLDWRIALITVALSVVAALLFGILPARAAARSGAASGSRTTAPGTDLRKALVVGELALAFVLVTATGLMTRAFTRLIDWNPGFRPDGLTVVWSLAKVGDTRAAVDLFDRAAHDIAAIPGVTAVGQSSAGPLFGGTEDEEMKLANGASKGSVRWYDVSPDYFRTLGVPLLRGRELRESDGAGSEPVALINEAAARRLFGDADPIGARVAIADGTWTIVGVVANVHPFRPDEEPRPEIYWPKRQSPRMATYFIIRSNLPPAALEKQAGDVVAKQEPSLTLFKFRGYDEIIRGRRVSPRFNVVVISILSALAFALAAIGIYGVVSFSVVSRTREIAVRLAVGADPRRVVREIVRDGGKVLLAGLLIGVVGAIAVARFVAAFLFGLSPFDPPTWIGVCAGFAAVVLIACWLPARRAARIDPAASLRVE